MACIICSGQSTTESNCLVCSCVTQECCTYNRPVFPPVARCLTLPSLHIAAFFGGNVQECTQWFANTL
jgi:hypothetical protein